MKAPDIISDMKEHNKQILSEKQIKQDNSLLIAAKTVNNKKVPLTVTIPNDVKNNETDAFLADYKISVLKINNQIKELHTVLRDR